MTRRDGIIATIAIVLGSLALAVLVNTDAYSTAARAEAKGYKALAREMSGDLVTDGGTVNHSPRINGVLTASASAAVQQ